uniref:Uncharacterized protein n=1 Tax=Anguilla anguilla TaxID=7936 RepID=A0A0E9QHF4_ANGAN
MVFSIVHGTQLKKTSKKNKQKEKINQHLNRIISNLHAKNRQG